MKIGIIGMGMVGHHLYNDFLLRKFDVIGYDKYKAGYTENLSKLEDRDVLFICVPTPTIKQQQDLSAIVEVLNICATTGAFVVIRSTILPGTTIELQKEFQSVPLLFSPEFLSEASAEQDIKNPIMNIIGITEEAQRATAEEIIKLYNKSKVEYIGTSSEAEFIKYAHNTFGVWKTVFLNNMFDITQSLKNITWSNIENILLKDPMVLNEGRNHVFHKRGRGAGGNCLIKDMSAFITFLKNNSINSDVQSIWDNLEKTNLNLLIKSNKDLDIIEKVYD